MTNDTHSSLDSNFYWNSKLELVAARCQRNLARYSSIEADDATQEAMIQLLRVDFLENYSPERGSIVAFINGMIDNICRKAVYRWHQRMNNQSPIDLALMISHSSSPEEVAYLQEVLEDIKAIHMQLTSAELQALPRVLERATGSRSICKSNQRPNYSAESRCRSKLRRLISHHNPYQDSHATGKEKQNRHHRQRLTDPKRTNPG